MSASKAAEAAAAAGAEAPGEEGIRVAIRMRPLNQKEHSGDSKSPTSSTAKGGRVWRVLSKYNSVTQTTAAGKPLPERIHNRNFFSYDRTFGENSTTQDVYDGTSKGIVDGVMQGMHGTIFAYGQTSSGKTHTMQGAGSVGEGNNGGGGIVHMAASDIFRRIQEETGRSFLIRVSFIEIYNEEVRDLLVSGDSKDNATLAIREDKQRGVFVNSNEQFVTSKDSLLNVLFEGEKHRSVGSTAMNERSSRSHTIFRITIESRLKETEKEDGDDEDEEMDSDDEALRGEDDGKKGAAIMSTLNLVDLAGSESVRHTNATGDRQKEGGKINQSLLTLSRVITSLGDGAAHVNFRDSKLTRLLQPSLSGNAKIAVICCATPSELYLEETRSTLMFASRAKLVKTRAQVNEVMDSGSMIKKLQRQLKEAQKGGPGKETLERMKALAQKAATAECAGRKAEEDLARMKMLILKGGVLPGNVGAYAGSLFVYNEGDETIRSGPDEFALGGMAKGNKKRRYSDGVINDAENGDPQLDGGFASPARGGAAAKKQAQTEMKPKRIKPAAHVQPSDMKDEVDIGLLREALAAKSAQAAGLKAKLAEAQLKAGSVEKKLRHEHGEKEMLRLAKQDLESQVSSLASDKDFALNEQDILMQEKETIIADSLERIEKMLEERKEQKTTVSELQAQVESLQEQVASLQSDKEEATQLVATKHRDIEVLNAEKAALEGQFASANTSSGELTELVTSLQTANTEAEQRLSEKDAELEEAKASITALQEEAQQRADELSGLTEAKASADERVSELETKLEEEQTASAAMTTDLEGKLEEATESNTKLAEQVASLERAGEETAKLLEEKEAALEEANAKIASSGEEATEAKSSLEARAEVLEGNLEAEQLAVEELARQHEVAEEDVLRLTRENNAADATIQELQSNLEDATSEREEHTAALEEAEASLQTMAAEKTDLEGQLSGLRAKYDAMQANLNTEEGALKTNIAELEAAVLQKDQEAATLNENLVASSARVEELTSEVEEGKASLMEVRLEKENVTQKLEDATSKLTAMETERDEGLAKAESAVAEKEKLVLDVEALEAKHSEDTGESAKEIDSLKLQASETATQVTELTGQVSTLSKEKEELAIRVESAASELEAAQAEAASLGARISELESTVESITSERDAANGRVAELLSGDEDRDSVVSSLTAEKDTLASSLNDAKATIARLETEKGEAEAKLSTTERDDAAAKAETAANIETAVADKDAEIGQLNDQLVLLNERLAAASNQDGDAEVVESLKKETAELKSLLASANASVDEARSSAQSAEHELEEKELQLEGALRNVAEHEEARRIAEDKLRLALESPRNSPARTDSEEELLKDMEVLMGEKIDAESRLEQELNQRKVIEDGLKKAAEDEKQQLMDEAEEKIMSLRDEISQLKSDLSRVESDCYTMKDDKADLQDQLTRAETRATDAESIVTSVKDELGREQGEKSDVQKRLDRLQEESDGFKSQVFAAKASFEADVQEKLQAAEGQLNEALSQLAGARNDAKLSKETIADLNSDIEQYRRELGSVKGVASNEKAMEMSKLREELAQTKLDLSHAETDCLSAKRELESAKEKVERVKKHEHDKQEKFAAKAKEAIETLKERLHKAESQKGSVGGESEEVAALKSTLVEKDARIKKLEKSKITKQQIQNIQKLKDERSQFMAEAKEYKQQLEELESKPRRAGLRERTGADVEKVQDDLKQCENKLRKYVQHSERLEQERKAVMEAVASSNVGDIVGETPGEMVASLCEKLAELEEECDALAAAEGKASEYLAELDSLREKFSALEAQVRGYDDCKDSLRKAQEKIARLTKDKESLEITAEKNKGSISDLQEERRRQLQYLENENLQLGDELKKTKKQRDELARERDTLMLQGGGGGGEQTVELKGLGALFEESATKPALMSGSKRLPLGSSKKRPEPESPVVGGGVSTDKENLLNKKQRTRNSSAKSPFGSAKKKKGVVNPFSSVKKAARRKLTSDTPTKSYALGEGGEPTADVTGECNQS